MKVDYFTPNFDTLVKIKEYSLAFDKKGIPPDERVGFIIKTMFANADLMRERGVDVWLSFGGTLPAVERVIAVHNGESETAFYRRTQYPKFLVDAYSIKNDDGSYNDFGTLVFADSYKNAHLVQMLQNTAIWQINSDGKTIALDLFENRLNGLK